MEAKINRLKEIETALANLQPEMEKLMGEDRDVVGSEKNIALRSLVKELCKEARDIIKSIGDSNGE